MQHMSATRAQIIKPATKKLHTVNQLKYKMKYLNLNVLKISENNQAYENRGEKGLPLNDFSYFAFTLAIGPQPLADF